MCTYLLSWRMNFLKIKLKQQRIEATPLAYEQCVIFRHPTCCCKASERSTTAA